MKFEHVLHECRKLFKSPAHCWSDEAVIIPICDHKETPRICQIKSHLKFRMILITFVLMRFSKNEKDITKVVFSYPLKIVMLRVNFVYLISDFLNEHIYVPMNISFVLLYRVNFFVYFHGLSYEKENCEDKALISR